MSTTKQDLLTLVTDQISNLYQLLGSTSDASEEERLSTLLEKASEARDKLENEIMQDLDPQINTAVADLKKVTEEVQQVAQSIKDAKGVISGLASVLDTATNLLAKIAML